MAFGESAKSAYSGAVAGAVGRNVRRKDSDAKVTGAAKDIDDLKFPGMLHGRTIRSTMPRGRVNSIRLDFDTAGFTVVDYRDIPGRNIVALIDDDQPCLAEREIRHFAEPVLLLAHADRERLLRAATCASTTRRSPRSSTLSLDAVVQEHRHRQGRRRRGLRRRRTSSSKASTAPAHQEQLYIETNGVIAVP